MTHIANVFKTILENFHHQTISKVKKNHR